MNTLYNALLNHPDFGKIDFSELKIAIGGGMAVQRAVAERWVKATGCALVEGYGLSETSPTLTCTPGDIDRIHRHDRPAGAVDRDLASATMPATKCRSASRARSARAGRR